MQFREINQHHIPAIISVLALFCCDISAFYLTYLVTVDGVTNIIITKYSKIILFFIVFFSYLFKRYDPSPTISRGHESKILIQLYYLIGIIYMFINIIYGSIDIEQAQYELIFIHVFIIFDILFRLIIRSCQRYFLRKGVGGRSTIIIGKGQDAYHIADEINRNPSFGFNLKGYFNESPNVNMDRYCSYLGDAKEIELYIKKNNIHEIIIALEEHEHKDLLNIIGKYNLNDVCIKIVPDMYESISGQVRINTIRGLPLLDINPDIMTEFQEVYKRIGDIILALVGLIIFFPLIIFCIILVFFSSKGNIFYKQIRVGINGSRFMLYKFRTMYENSEIDTGPIWSQIKDPRITKVGKLMRKYHLDEIPQLINVLYGHMSIVGPRPERPEIINKLINEIPYYNRRFKVKPGLTGWAQVKGVYDTNLSDVKQKLKHDCYYIENISILLDIKIIIITMLIIIKGEGR